MKGTHAEKIMSLMDKMSEEDRAMIASTYYQKPEKELSPKVTRLKKVYEKLDKEEQNDFIKLCGARMISGAGEEMEYPEGDGGPDGVGVIIATDAPDMEGKKNPDEKKEDLSDK